MGAVVVALVALGGLAAGAGGQRTDVAVDVPDPGPVLDMVLIGAMVLGALLGAALLVVRRGARPSAAERRTRHLLVVGAFLLLVAVASRLGPLPGQEVAEPPPEDPGSEIGGPIAERPDDGPVDTRTVPLVVVVLGVAVVGGMVLVLLRRPEPDPVGDESVDPGPPVAALLDDAAEAVRADPDPRRAVLRCYAALEVVLAGHGLARDPAETPGRWLARVAPDLRARTDAARELAWTFERARYSVEPIDGADRERALAALLAVRDGLREPA